MMKLVLDATGGDFAPDSNLQGAADAVRSFEDLEIILIGPQKEIEDRFHVLFKDQMHETFFGRISFLDAPEVITPDEHPAMALRTKKKSPFVMGMQMIHNKEADAFLSAGSTGAVMAGAMFISPK